MTAVSMGREGNINIGGAQINRIINFFRHGMPNNLLPKRTITDRLVQKPQMLLHQGRTDGTKGHYDYQNQSKLGFYHFHHTLPPHNPCNHFKPAGDTSLIDLFTAYGGTAITNKSEVNGHTTFSFHAFIEIGTPGVEYFGLKIAGTKEESEFYTSVGSARTHIEPFFGTGLKAFYDMRIGSPWEGAAGGIDYLVDAEYFHALVKSCTGLERPVKGREIIIPAVVNGEVKTLYPLEEWGLPGDGTYDDEKYTLKDENGYYKVAVAPKILEPNYPDTGKIWRDEFEGKSKKLQVTLEHKLNQQRKTINCVVIDVKAHSYNTYNGHHPKNSGDTACFGIENGLIQTGIAYPNSSNALSEEDLGFAYDNIDASVIEFCVSKEKMDFNLNDFRLVRLLQMGVDL